MFCCPLEVELFVPLFRIPCFMKVKEGMNAGSTDYCLLTRSNKSLVSARAPFLRDLLQWFGKLTKNEIHVFFIRNWFVRN